MNPIKRTEELRALFERTFGEAPVEDDTFQYGYLRFLEGYIDSYAETQAKAIGIDPEKA